MYYDLHIHSALSPCGDELMTINNIFNMAYIKGLDFIAICDHNTVKQQFYLNKVIESDVLKGKIDFIHGVELQTKEDIHVLGYFQKGSDLNQIQSWIEQHLPYQKNDIDFYGHQYIYNQNDEIIEEYNQLLIQSLDLSIEEVIQGIHQLGGIAVLAHVMSKRFGAYEILKEKIIDLNYDGIEVTYMKEWNDLRNVCPDIKETLILVSSDAHYLEDINEPFYQIDKDQFMKLLEEKQWKK